MYVCMYVCIEPMNPLYTIYVLCYDPGYNFCCALTYLFLSVYSLGAYTTTNNALHKQISVWLSETINCSLEDSTVQLSDGC